MTVICGLDSATTSGAAILRGDRLVHAEFFRPKGSTDAEIFAGFRIWWRALLKANEVEEVAIEEPLRTDLSMNETEDRSDVFGSSRFTVKKPIGTMRTFLRLYGIRAHAIEVCHSINVPCREVNNATWRSKIYGGRRPPRGLNSAQRSAWWKQQALNHCALIGWDIKSKDAAEGAMIAEYLRITLKEERLGYSARPGEFKFGESAA